MKFFTLDTMLKACELLNINQACCKDDLKANFRRLCSMHHPDKGGSTEKMQCINWAYDYVLKHFDKLVHTFSSEPHLNENLKFKLSEEGKGVFEQLIILPELEIYIIGCWIWVGGNTKPVKDVLKQLGLYWHAKKSMWAYAGSKTRSKGNMQFEEMCGAYGSTKHRTKETKKIVS